LKITAWRIFKRRYKASAFSGDGARLFGGRWNSKGVAVVYTSASPSLGILEMLVHLQRHELVGAYLLAPVTFDGSLVQALPKLPSNWRRYPAPPALQKLGDRWLEERMSAVLQVPSVIIPAEANFLLNPQHPDFSICAIGGAQSFRFDRRLTQTEV
jgi:RES domain-containing protein